MKRKQGGNTGLLSSTSTCCPATAGLPFFSQVHIVSPSHCVCPITLQLTLFMDIPNSNMT